MKGEMDSPLTNLSNVLATVRASADSYGPYLEREATTRAVLIDPVLRALGWDIANPVMVEVEASGTFRRGRIYADYGLKTDDEIVAVVEAKQLGGDLTTEYDQLVGYSFGFGVDKIFLTDGIIWQHFTEFRPGSIDPVKTLNLKTDDLEEIAAYLVQELDAALISPQRAQIDLLSEQVDQLREEIEKLRHLEERLKVLESKSNTPANREPAQPKKLTTRVSTSWTPLTKVGKLQRTKPRNLRLPDQTKVAVKSWGQVLLECCRFVLQSGPNIPMPLPDSAGKKTNLIQTVPFPPNLNSKEVEVSGEVFYIHVNYGSSTAVKNALYILNMLETESSVAKAAVVYG